MLRQRKRKAAMEVVKELDAFTKVPESYVVTSTSGGTISIAIFIAIAFLVVSEMNYYTSSKFKFRYSVDTDFESKLKINVDITVAMPCSNIGADVLDTTNENAETFGQLNEEPTWFELTPKQRVHWDSMMHVNNYLREEFHSIQDFLWGSGYTSMFGSMPRREIERDELPDACRFYGTLEVKKLAGNLHITAGKPVPYLRGHAHLSTFINFQEYNFSHRIERLSFGDTAPGIINPLDAEQKITDKNFYVYQYYVQVVPTDIHTFRHKSSTYQYSVTEQERIIDHEHGSHGVPGIYFKYDMSSIKIKVSEDREHVWQFLVRLCAIVGGVFATSGIINSFVGTLVDFVYCRREAKYKVPTENDISVPTNNVNVPLMANVELARN
ncbi:hypothetical protein CHUAL_010171 [Chamberlinius hualienensis]